jgi:adenine-specific DNA methylase
MRPHPIDSTFDVELANKLARLESYNKHLYRPNTYLHKWWARRCGSTFRLLLKHLAEDEDSRDYYAPGGLEGKIVLDPMMGGGTTLHEAVRLGANVIGVDLDPIPVLQARATLSDVPLAELEDAFTSFYEELEARLNGFFETTCLEDGTIVPVRFILYGLRRHCDCGETVFVDSFVLQRKADGTTTRICPYCREVLRTNVSCNCEQTDLLPPLKEKGTRSCPECGSKYEDDLSVPFYARYTPLVAVGQCSSHGLIYGPLSEADNAQIARANDRRAGLGFGSELKVHPGPKSSDLIRRRVHSYLDLFSSRQLIYLQGAIEVLAQFDGYSRLYLALIVSTSLEFNSMLCGYKGSSMRRPGAIRHTFSHHAYSFPYTALENNPLNHRFASGTLQKLFHDRVRRARKWATAPQERVVNGKEISVMEIDGEVDTGTEVSEVTALTAGVRQFHLMQGSSTRLELADDSVDYVVTDPPYFDSVQYGDLSAFFRVWLALLLPDEERLGIEWNYDLSRSAVSPPGNIRSQPGGTYVALMTSIVGECARVLRKDGGRLIFSFHHWNPNGWAAITIALKKSGFRLVNRFVVHSENPVSVHVANLKALTDDAILVLAPTGAGNATEWSHPGVIDTADSARFCEECATLLGWMLERVLSDEEVARLWQQSLS